MCDDACGSTSIPPEDSGTLKSYKNKHIIDRLISEIDKKQNPCIVGLDTRIDMVPEHIKSEAAKETDNPKEQCANAIHDFNVRLVEALHDIVPAFKIQSACYEKYGAMGVKVFELTVEAIKEKGCFVIGDFKRNDIGSTAEEYAKAHIGFVEDFSGKSSIPGTGVDMMTVNPYFGIDGVKPFIDVAKENGNGIFVLVRTSNKSAGDLQDLPVIIDGPERAKFTELIKRGKGIISLDTLVNESEKKSADLHVMPIYAQVARLVREWGLDSVGERGYSTVGAVVGATYSGEAALVRELMPNTFVLVTGYDVQGGSAAATMPNFKQNGYGAIVHSARGVIAAYRDKQYQDKFKPEQYAEAARQAALDMKEDITAAMKAANKYPW